MFEGRLHTTLWLCQAYLLRLKTGCATSLRLCWVALFSSTASGNRKGTRIGRRQAAAIYWVSTTGLKNTSAGKPRFFTSLTYAGSRGNLTTELSCMTGWTCPKSKFGSGTYRFTESMNDHSKFITKVEHTVWVSRTLLYFGYWIQGFLVFFGGYGH